MLWLIFVSHANFVWVDNCLFFFLFCLRNPFKKEIWMDSNVLQVVFLSIWGRCFVFVWFKTLKFPCPFNATRMELWCSGASSNCPACRWPSRARGSNIFWPFVAAFSRQTQKSYLKNKSKRLDFTYNSTVQPTRWIRQSPSLFCLFFLNRLTVTGVKRFTSRL